MIAYCVDTSALLKRYRTEQGTETMNSLLHDKRAGEAIITSYFGALELEAVAARLLRGRVLTRRAYQRCLAQFLDDLTKYVTLYPLDNVILEDAAALIRRHALRASDALHLATARSIRSVSSVRTVFVASDHYLLEAAKHEGFPFLDPQAADSLRDLTQFRLS